MNIFKKIEGSVKTLITVGAIALAAAGFAPRAAADGATVAMQTTNNLAPGDTNIVGYPTNGTTHYQTGAGVNVDGMESYIFMCSGFLSNSTAAVIYVQLTTAAASPGRGSGPQFLGATTNQNDWAYQGYGTASFSIQVPADTNWFNWQTNIASTTVAGQAGWIGIYKLTNNFAAGQMLTNPVGSNGNGLFFIYKKVKPVILNGGF